MPLVIPSFRNAQPAVGLNAPAGVSFATAGQAVSDLVAGANAARRERSELLSFADALEVDQPEVADTLRTRASFVPLFGGAAGGAGGRGRGGGSRTSDALLGFALSNAQSRRDFEESQRLQRSSHDLQMSRLAQSLANSKELAQFRHDLENSGSGFSPVAAMLGFRGPAAPSRRELFDRFAELQRDPDVPQATKDVAAALMSEEASATATRFMVPSEGGDVTDEQFIAEARQVQALLANPDISAADKDAALANFERKHGSGVAGQATQTTRGNALKDRTVQQFKDFNEFMKGDAPQGEKDVASGLFANEFGVGVAGLTGGEEVDTTMATSDEIRSLQESLNDTGKSVEERRIEAAIAKNSGRFRSGVVDDISPPDIVVTASSRITDKEMADAQAVLGAITPEAIAMKREDRVVSDPEFPSIMDVEPGDPDAASRMQIRRDIALHTVREGRRQRGLDPVTGLPAPVSSTAQPTTGTGDPVGATDPSEPQGKVLSEAERRARELTERHRSRSR